MIIGPTGEFPDGKVREDDDGEINIAIGRAGNNVIMEFGKPVKWIGFPPHVALDLAKSLMNYAAKIQQDPELPKNWDS